MTVRVRFAPSPTGLLHLGGARTALFNFLFAKANRGQCVLRIEDTDKARYVPGSVEKLESSLKWLGVEFDEGPSQGGTFGPYFQSERLNLYQKFASELVKKGAAYHCFCSKERLQSLKVDGRSYDGHCRRLSQRQVEEYLRMGSPNTVRLKVPHVGHTTVRDQVYGMVQVKSMTMDDQILLKTDGYPTYHLAAVVDDHCMEISHVLRGEEWLLSTAKHLLVYRGLGWEAPVFAHLPLLLASSGGKLSKRNQDVFVESYQQRGFLPEAVVNFLALLGWSPKSEQEMFTTDELVSVFSLESVNKKSVVVDEEKLLWMNKHHFTRRLCNPSELQHLAEELQKQLEKRPTGTGTIEESKVHLEYLKKVLLLLEERISLMPRIPEEASYFWEDPSIERTSQMLSLVEDQGMLLEAVKASLEQSDFSKDSINSTLRELSTNLNVPYRKLMLLCRLAVTGAKASPSLAGVMELLGRSTVMRRLQLACQIAGKGNTCI